MLMRIYLALVFAGSLCASIGFAARRPAGMVTRIMLTRAELDATQRIHFTLKLRHYDELCAKVSHGEVMSLAELRSRYLPTPDTWAKVAAWAAANGFEVQPEDSIHLAVFARAPISNVQAALGVRYARMLGADGLEHTSTDDVATVPPALQAEVVGVGGLKNHLKPQVRRTATITVGDGQYLQPDALRQIYHADASEMDGEGQTIVILGSDRVDPADLTAFWSACGLPTTLAQFEEIDQNGPPTDDHIIESTMDVEAASAMAPKAKILLISGGYGPATAILLLNRIATDPGLRQISVSAALSESAYSYSDPGQSQVFATLAAAGITFFASSGDSGSGGNRVPIGGYYDPNLAPSAEYPASDPFVTAVGGTAIRLLYDGMYQLPATEGGWTLPDPPITLPGKAPNESFTASGGGVSIFYPRPAWQKGAGMPAGNMRCVPDVAAMAIGSPPFFVYYEGHATGGGGTSLSSPLWAGLCALLNQARFKAGLPALGLLGPHLYPLMGTPAFNQITTGSSDLGTFTTTANNGAYPVGPNYNLVTGLGSPNIAQLALALTTGAETGAVPALTSQPAAATIISGNPVTLAATASGASLEYQWYFNSVRSYSPGDTSSNDDLGMPIAGATSPTYMISAAMPEDAGWYRLGVNNGAGIVFSSPARLTVNYAPIITAQPAAQAVAPGFPALLRVAAAGVPEPVYQWYFNGEVIAGATSSTYVITAADASTLGDYSVIASNDIGAVQSNRATVSLQTSGSTVGYQFTTLAGTATYVSSLVGNKDGSGGAARFETPRGVAVDVGGNVYVSDSGWDNFPYLASEAIRKITAEGVVTTLAGLTNQPGAADGDPATATFDGPSGICVDGRGNVYVSDSVNHTIRMITPAGITTTLAGLAGQSGDADGTGSEARFNAPGAIAVDAEGNLFIADSVLEEIRKCTSQGVVTTIAGGGGVSIDLDGAIGEARFRTPRGIAVDRMGNIYVADSEAGTVRKISASGVVTTLAGNAAKRGSDDGVGSAASFNFPEGIAVDANGTVFVADTGNSLIRRITPDGTVTTIGGLPGEDGATDGIGIVARFRQPRGVAVDSSGNVYVADTNNGTIRKGTVRVVEAPAISIQPQSETVPAGGGITLETSSSAAWPANYLWLHNGAIVTDAIESVLSVAPASPDRTGIYSAIVAGTGWELTSDPAIVGVSTDKKVIGSGEELQPTDISHPNGHIFDQVLVTGAAETITADAGQVTRTSFIDLDDDIVQVEFSGHGSLSLVLDDPTGPATPVNYDQPKVNYMKGHAGIVIVGADETTNVGVFSVGRATANDNSGHYNILKDPTTPGAGGSNDPMTNGSPLFVGHEDTHYDGIADITFIAILSTDGKFGGVRTADANYFAHRGLTGVYAPGVEFTGPLYIGNITAFDEATPVIQVGAVSDARITGGDLFQDNGAVVQVSGLTKLKFTAGGDSGGNVLPAKVNQAVLEQDGVNVTAQVVVGPE